MSIEGNVLSNTFANNAAENAYQNTLTTRDDLHLDAREFNIEVSDPLPNAEVLPKVNGIVASSEMSPGDEILGSLQKISENHQQKTQSLLEAVERTKDEGLTVSNLVTMQTKLMEQQLTNEIISKSANSLSQGVQTLLRNQ